MSLGDTRLAATDRPRRRWLRVFLIAMLAPLAIGALTWGAWDAKSWWEYWRVSREFASLEVPSVAPTEEQIRRGQRIIMLAARASKGIDRRDLEWYRVVSWDTTSALPPLEPSLRKKIELAGPAILELRQELLSAPPPALPERFSVMGTPQDRLDDVPDLLGLHAVLDVGEGRSDEAMLDLEAAWRTGDFVGLDGRARGNLGAAIIVGSLLRRLDIGEAPTWFVDRAFVESSLEHQRRMIRSLLECAREGELVLLDGCIAHHAPPGPEFQYRPVQRKAWSREAELAMADLRVLVDSSRCLDEPQRRHSRPGRWEWSRETPLPPDHLAHVGVLRARQMRVSLDLTRAVLAWRARRSDSGRWPLDFDPSPYSTCSQVHFVLDATDTERPVLLANAAGARWWGRDGVPGMTIEAHQPARP